MNPFPNQQVHILETERLRLRQFDLEDADFIIELLNSPGWLEYIGDRSVRTKGQAESYLQNGPLTSYQQNCFGLCMVQTKGGKPVGMCGILKRPTLDNPDIGFAFLPEFMGQGYAHEIASATLSYAINVLEIPKISAITLPHNTKSIKLLEKIGMKFTSSFPQEGEELLLYEIEITR